MMKARATKPRYPKKPPPPEDDGAPLIPIPEPPLLDTMHIVRDKRPRTTAEALLDGLRSNGFKLRIEDDKLIVSPVSKLTMLQRDALKKSKTEICSILAWEAAEPPATDNAMAAWYKTLEKQPGEKPAIDTATLRSLSRNAKQRRIVLLDEAGSVERVLANPVEAEKVIEEVRRLGTEYPGRTLAAEWLGPMGWTRWLTKKGEI